MLPLFSLSFPQSLSYYLGSCKTIIFQLLQSPVKKRVPSFYTLLFDPFIFKFYFNMSKPPAVIFLLGVQIDPHLECEALQVAPLSLQCDPIISKCFLVQQVLYFHLFILCFLCTRNRITPRSPGFFWWEVDRGTKIWVCSGLLGSYWSLGLSVGRTKIYTF